MDIERIQKVNNLALDLVKQGLAPDRESALAQAEQILQGVKGSQEYSELRQNIEVKKEPIQVIQDLSKDQIRDILEKNTTFLVKTIKDFNAKIITMENEISSLRSQIHAVPKVKEIVTQVSATNTSGPAQNKESHPRSGNYNDTDVSIEKYFYMGKK